MGKSSLLARHRCCVALIPWARPKFRCLKQNWEAWSRDDIVAMMFIFNEYCRARSYYEESPEGFSSGDELAGPPVQVFVRRSNPPVR
jgi:hypothetical protein